MGALLGAASEGVIRGGLLAQVPGIAPAPVASLEATMRTGIPADIAGPSTLVDLVGLAHAGLTSGLSSIVATAAGLSILAGASTLLLARARDMAPSTPAAAPVAAE